MFVGPGVVMMGKMSPVVPAGKSGTLPAILSHADNIANGFDNIKLQIQIRTKMHIWGRVKFMMDSSEDPST